MLLRVAERQPDPWLDLCKTHLPINVPRQRRALGGGLSPRERPRASQVLEGRLSTSKTLRQLAGWTGRGPLPLRARRRAWMAGRPGGQPVCGDVPGYELGVVEGAGGLRRPLVRARGCDFNVPYPLPVGSIGGERMTWPVAGWSSLGPEVARLLFSPVDSEGGERRTWLAGRWWPTLCAFVCPLRIELGPRNACAHDSRPVRVGESVWEWSSTVDGVDGMAWHGMA